MGVFSYKAIAETGASLGCMMTGEPKDWKCWGSSLVDLRVHRSQVCVVETIGAAFLSRGQNAGSALVLIIAGFRAAMERRSMSNAEETLPPANEEDANLSIIHMHK